MSKITLGLAFAAGYVVGAKAGRDRYEQIRSQAQKVAEHPRVQSATDSAKHKAGEVASSVAETAAEKVGEVVEVAKDKVTSQTEQPGGPISAAP